MKIAVECTNIYLAEITRTWKASFRTQYRPKTCINIMKIDFWQSVVWIPFSMESNKHNTIPQSIGPWMSSFICMTLAKYLSQKSTCWSDVMFGIVCLFVVCVSVGRGGGEDEVLREHEYECVYVERTKPIRKRIWHCLSDVNIGVFQLWLLSTCTYSTTI